MAFELFEVWSLVGGQDHEMQGQALLGFVRCDYRECRHRDHWGG